MIDKKMDQKWIDMYSSPILIPWSKKLINVYIYKCLHTEKNADLVFTSLKTKAKFNFLRVIRRYYWTETSTYTVYNLGTLISRKHHSQDN